MRCPPSRTTASSASTTRARWAGSTGTVPLTSGAGPGVTNRPGFDAEQQPGPEDLAAIGDGGVGHGHLQGRHEVEALPDRRRHGFTLHPDLAEAPLLPLAGGDESRLLLAESDARAPAQVESARDRGQAIDAELQPSDW